MKLLPILAFLLFAALPMRAQNPSGVGTKPMTCANGQLATGTSPDGSPLCAGSCVTISALSGGPVNLACDAKFIGPAPYVDARMFGVRTMNPLQTPAAPGITTDCVAGNNHVTLSSLGAGGPSTPNNVFRVGDGIALVGCGASHSMTQPKLTTVTPVISNSGMNTGYNAASATGSAVRYYKIALMNPSQGVSQASAEFTLSNGIWPLGGQSFNVTSCSTTGNSTTCTLTTTGTGLPVSCAQPCGRVELMGTSDSYSFNGWWNMASVPSSTSFTFLTPRLPANGNASTATGGTIRYYLGDQLTLPAVTGDGSKFLIYESTSSGAETLVGVSIPQLSTLNGDSSWNLYTFWGNRSCCFNPVSYPTYYPTSPPTSPRPDTLVTTITAIDGNIVTLAVAPSNSTTGSQVTFDNTPNAETANGITTGSSNGGGYVMFPPDPSKVGTYYYYVFNSHSYFNNIVYGRPLWLNDTMDLYGTISALPVNNDLLCQSFALECQLPVDVHDAKPGIITHSGWLHDMAVQVYGNDNIGVFDVTPNSGYQSHVVYTAQNGSIDFLNTFYYQFAANPAGSFGHYMDHISLIAATAQTDGLTDAPAFISKNNGEMNYKYFSGNIRGMFWKPGPAGASVDMDWGQEVQGPIMPIFVFTNCVGSIGVYFHLHNIVSDTSEDPVVANSGCSAGSVQLNVTIDGASSIAQGAAYYSGWPASSLTVKDLAQVTMPTQVGQNYNLEMDTGGQKYLWKSTNVNSNFSFGVLPGPGAPTARVTTTGCSGSFPQASNYNFVVNWWDRNTNPATGAGGHTAWGAFSGSYRMDGSTQCAVITQPPNPPQNAAFWTVAAFQNGNSNNGGYVYVGYPCPGTQWIPITTTSVTWNAGFFCGMPPSTNNSAQQYITPSSGMLTKTPYRTVSATTNKNIGATAMVSSIILQHEYRFNFTISLTTAGTGCKGPTTLVVNKIFTDPNGGGQVTVPVDTVQLTNSANYNGVVGYVKSGDTSILAAAGSTVSYSTSSYTAGTGCSVNPSYVIQPTLTEIW